MKTEPLPKQVETGHAFMARMARVYAGQAKWLDKNGNSDDAESSRRYAEGLKIQAASLKNKATRRAKKIKTHRVKLIRR